MKNITFIVAACCLMMAACAQSPKSAENQKNSQTNQKEMKNTLIVYFSATCTTKAAAQKLAQEFNADLPKTAASSNAFRLWPNPRIWRLMLKLC